MTIDAAALGEGPDGYLIDRPMSARQAIEPLALAFAFEAAERDGAIVFRPRGGAPVVELSEDDFVLPSDAAPFRLTRAQETELPHEVALGYSDGGSDFRRAVVTSRKLVGGSARLAQADLAAVTSDAAAARRAEIWLQDIWAGREGADFALPPSRLMLCPGDVIGLTLNGRRHLLELREAVDTGARSMKARTIDPEVFDLPLASPLLRPPEPPPAIGPPHALVLDLPALDAAEPVVLARLAVFADPWPGSVAVWKSGDGLSFENAALALAPSIMGETLDDLPAGPTGRWHRARVRVRLYGGALSSVSDGVLLAGANAAALRREDGAFEVLQFAQAELVGEGTYELTRLLRGQAGSEHAIGDPLAAGAPFVLLDPHVLAIAGGLDALDRAMQLRVVAAGLDHGDPAALALEAVPQSTALRPLSPVHLRARRVAEGIAFGWIRRTRVDGDGWSAEVPLGEESERYVLDILSGADVLRTIEATVPSALYASADELDDFGAPQTSLSIRVAQVSATVGRGFVAEAILTL